MYNVSHPVMYIIVSRLFNFTALVYYLLNNLTLVTIKSTCLGRLYKSIDLFDMFQSYAIILDNY